MMQKDKKAIIFDFGNVIAFFDYDKVVTNLATLTDNQLSPSEVKDKLFAKNLLNKFEVGNISASDFVRQVQQRLGLENIPEEKIIDTWTNLFTPNEEVINVIAQIPDDITLVLGSTTNPIHFKYYRREFSDTLDRFKAFVTSFQLGSLKPDPAFYEQCLKEANCQPKDCVYVDDISQYVDAAAQMGIEGITYSPDTDIAAKLRKKGVTL